MKLFKSTLVIVVLLTSIICACKKKEAPTPELDQTSIKDFFNQAGPQLQIQKFNAANLPKTLTFNGIEITFPLGSLKRSGIPVSGEVTVEVYELMDRKNICLAGANTNYVTGFPLTSDGIVYFDVKSDGISVDQSLTVPVTISFPSNRSGETFILKGVDQGGNALAEAKDHQMSWADIYYPNTNITLRSTPVRGKLTFPLYSLGWINFAVLYRPSPRTTLSVEVLNNPGSMGSFKAYNGETFVYICAKGNNVLTQLYTPEGENKVKSADGAIPKGMNCRAIAFCVKEGKYYFGSKETIVSANQTIQVSLAEVTRDALTAAMEELTNY